MKRILMVSSEAVPYIKTGGLADVVGSLPRYVNKKEYDVRVIVERGLLYKVYKVGATER